MSAENFAGEEKVSRRITYSLSSAALEWLLMVLLFLNALFSYLVTKLARIAKLPKPCLLCSRLDHILGNENPGFYKDLLCRYHMSEISSLALCHAHQKLSDVHDMCESCLLSFATEKKSNPETYRLLVGIFGSHLNDSEVLGVEHDEDAASTSLPRMDIRPGSTHTRHCSCCSKSFADNEHVSWLIQKHAGEEKVAEPDGFSVEKLNSDLCFDDEPNYGKVNSVAASPTYHHQEDPSFHHLPHVGYSELKITSDTESEVQFSDEEERVHLLHSSENILGDVSQCHHPDSISLDSEVFPANVTIAIAHEKLIPSSDILGESLSVIKEANNVNDSRDSATLVTTSAPLHCFENITVDVSQGFHPQPVSIDSDILRTNVSIDLTLEKLIHPDSDILLSQSLSVSKEASSENNSSDSANLAAEVGDEHCTYSSSLFHLSRNVMLDDSQGCHLATASISSEILHETVSTDMAEEKLHLDSDILGQSNYVTKEASNFEECGRSANLAAEVIDEHGLNGFTWNLDKANGYTPASADLLLQPAPSEVSNNEVDHMGTCDLDSISGTANGEKPEAVASDDFDMDKYFNGHKLCTQGSMDLNDAYKLAVGSKGNVTSPTVTDVITGKDSSRLHEDLRLFLSQISAARGVALPSNDASPSPRVQGQVDEFMFTDTSASALLENITKRLLFDRNESGLESLEGSIVSEIDGESPLERLKRQIELDRKSMSILYKELEEERNASAVAANQAMAMITRLQEEKAAMQMEALQYQRMMEEQSEYDQEALQMASDLLTQREKELQDLEAELESYRKQCGDELLDRSREQIGEVEPGESCSYTASFSDPDKDDKFEDKDISSHGSKLIDIGLSKDSLLDFENEKSYISECLRRIEKKIHLFSENGVCIGVSPLPSVANGHLHSCSKGQNSEEAICIDDVEQLYCATNSTKHLHSNRSFHFPHQDAKEDLQSNADGGLAALEKEILDLNKRLKTLEADQNFLEHAINSLRNGSDGAQYIQEIASHLRELRNIGI